MRIYKLTESIRKIKEDQVKELEIRLEKLRRELQSDDLIKLSGKNYVDVDTPVFNISKN
jgi:urease accessory protein UreE